MALSTVITLTSIDTEKSLIQFKKTIGSPSSYNQIKGSLLLSNTGSIMVAGLFMLKEPSSTNPNNQSHREYLRGGILKMGEKTGLL